MHYASPAMLVREAMIPTPVTCRPEDSFRELLERLLHSQQGAAAVLNEKGELVGMVGFHHVLRKIVPLYVDLDAKLMEVMHEGYLEERLNRLQGHRVRDFMIPETHAVSPKDSLIKAAAILVEEGRKTLPVLEGPTFLGMITRRSLFEKVTEKLLSDAAPASAPS